MDTATLLNKNKPETLPDLPYTLSNILKLRLSGKSYPEIAAYFGKSKQAIHERCQGVLAKISSEKLQAYRDHEPEILETAKSIIIDSLVKDDKLEKASINNLAYAFDQISKELHLKKGEATAHMLSVNISADEFKSLKSYSADNARRIAFGIQDVVVDESIIDGQIADPHQ